MSPFTLLNYITSYRSLNPYIEDQTSFYEWLAGFIDGDGYFTIRNGKYPVLFIEQETKNLSVLLFIQSKLGGSIGKRSRGDCYVYNLSSRSEMIVLLHGINGNIRNSIRLPQFYKVCSILNITPLPIIPLSLHNGWFAGFFDADGNISGYFTKTPYIVIQVTNKLDCNLEPFMLFFKGNIYHSKSNNVYKWKIGSKKDVMSMLSYFMMYPSMSHKFNRIGLITPFYNLVTSRAYKETADPVLINQWNKLMNDWKIVYTISRV
jgi:hypothetical protein